jgi:hypothetical protein
VLLLVPTNKDMVAAEPILKQKKITWDIISEKRERGTYESRRAELLAALSNPTEGESQANNNEIIFFLSASAVVSLSLSFSCLKREPLHIPTRKQNDTTRI